jgi:hypothetical protein
LLDDLLDASTISVKPHDANEARMTNEARLTLTNDTAKLVIILVGLPARGKSLLGHKLEQFLGWRGYITKGFRVGAKRRELAKEDNPAAQPSTGSASFFDATQAYAAAVREMVSIEAFGEAMDWLSTGGQVAIFDASNVQVITVRAKADSGFNRYYWGMEGKGIRQSGGGGRGGRMGGVRNNADEPGGLPVDPGTYKVVISLGKDVADSCFITVQDDPNAPIPATVRTSLRKTNQQLDQSTTKLVDLNDRLTEADEIIKKVEAGYKDMDPKKADTLRKVNKAMQDSLKAIREVLNGKPQEKQGYGNVPQVTVNSLMGEARMTVMGKKAIPGPQEQRLIKDAEEAVNKVIERANNFFGEPWKNYRNLVESAPVKIFKDYTPLK